MPEPTLGLFVLLVAPIMLLCSAYIAIIGFSGPADFWTNLSIDSCLDAGGRYDHSVCEGS